MVNSRLLSLWPGLKLVKWSTEIERESDIEPAAAATISAALNDTISLLREVRKTRDRVARGSPQALKYFSKGL